MKQSRANLRFVAGKGFDHEIIDDNSDYFRPVARVDAGRDDGLYLGRLFATAPDLLYACEQTILDIQTILSWNDIQIEETRLLKATLDRCAGVIAKARGRR